ncbi:MAG: hypothetical protein ABEN55_19315 [Bradymonadaceae bacterium]
MTTEIVAHGPHTLIYFDQNRPQLLLIVASFYGRPISRRFGFGHGSTFIYLFVFRRTSDWISWPGTTKKGVFDREAYEEVRDVDQLKR